MHLLVSLILSIGLLASGAAQATTIPLSATLGVSPNAFLDLKGRGTNLLPVTLSIDDLLVIESNSSSRTTGSGTASARTSGWHSGLIDADVFASLGDGPGLAEASLLNVSTFNLIFPRSGFYRLEALIEFADRAAIDTGDSGFAGWNFFFALATQDNALFEFGDIDNGFVCQEGPCSFEFDHHFADLLVDIGPDLRLPVYAEARFDIGVFRPATAVPEPHALPLLLGALAWLGGRRFSQSRKARRRPQPKRRPTPISYQSHNVSTDAIRRVPHHLHLSLTHYG